MMICLGPEQNALQMPETGTWSSWNEKAMQAIQQQQQQQQNGGLIGLVIVALVLLLLSGGDRR